MRVTPRVRLAVELPDTAGVATDVAVTVTLPGATAVSVPVLVMVARLVGVTLHETAVDTPASPITEAETWTDVPTTMVPATVTPIERTWGGGGDGAAESEPHPTTASNAAWRRNRNIVWDSLKGGSECTKTGNVIRLTALGYTCEN